jgi:voltage-gated potassium channel Kch
MGRVGIGAYRAINCHSTNKAWGLDADKDKISWLTQEGIEAYYGDGEDSHFWESMKLNQLELVLLALPTVQDSITVTTLLRAANYKGKIAAVARYDDERLALEEFGIDKVFNFYNEAGVGFAEESMALLSKSA